MTNQDDDRVESKSERRRTLERALWKRAQRPGKDNEVTWGFKCWTTNSPPRHAGEAWFRDQSGAVVRVIIQGMKSGDALGDALIDAIERMPEPAPSSAAQNEPTAPAQGRLGGIV